VTELDPEKLLRTLVDHRVEFCVIGAVAALLQGSPAATSPFARSPLTR
jgi:hypothetical protein